MKPERIGLELRQRNLIEWISIQRPELQAIQRTFTFPTYELATKFVNMIGEMATETEVFPHIEVFTLFSEAVPTQVQVTFADPDLQIEHFDLACILDVMFAEEMAFFIEQMDAAVPNTVAENETASAVTLTESE